MTKYCPPLAIYFIWHPADETVVQPMIDQCASLLQRDINRPFSRSMNLPIFYRTTSKKGPPCAVDINSSNSICFIFIGKNIVGDKDWCDYIQSLPDNANNHILPIAIDILAFNLNALKTKNFIRTYEFGVTHRNELFFISVAHEIYRLILNESFSEKKLGKDNALKIFLSHAKDGKQGLALAKGLKHFIDNSAMRNFFDATDIAPGYKFDDEIIGHIKDSTVVAIHSDPYSSRYWCQREILCAKEFHRPLVAVDCLEILEDRRFPYGANIPGIHIHLEDHAQPNKKDLLRILVASLLETVRFYYSKLLLNEYKNIKWIPKNSIIISRPPEVGDISKILKKNKKGFRFLKEPIIYPDPPVYDEELILFKDLQINCFTPLNYRTTDLLGKKIGVSISDPSKEELLKIGQKSLHLIQFSQDLAKHLLAKGSVLVYGGDLREYGFTGYILKEAQALQVRLQTENIHLENYIAWPIYKNDSMDVTEWKARYNQIATMNAVDPPNDVLDLIPDRDGFLSPTNTQNLYVWSRCLTEMRNIMITGCDVRICAGGRQKGYKGKYPGILEEILIALSNKKPLFLLGGFGGVTGNVCKFMQTKKMPEELSETWQIKNNSGYKDLLDYSSSRHKNYVADYDEMENSLKKAELNNGLTKVDNNRLFTTQFIDEAIYLIFKGLIKMHQ